MLIKNKETTLFDKDNPQSNKPKRNWLKISIIINLVFVGLAIIFLSSGYILHQSDTNPEFCGSCHIMQTNVQSYLSGNTLDHVHALANIECKDCHDYSVMAEIKSGINYISGNYEIVSLENPTLLKHEYGDEMCLKCHISMDYVAIQTDFLVRNPHLNHWDNLRCSDCHLSHGEQIDYCNQCHDNGSQRMTGGAIIPRADNPWISEYNSSGEITLNKK